MVDKKLLDWVLAEKAKGYSDEELKKSLLNSRYSFEQVEELFAQLYKPTDQTTPKKEESFFKLVSQKGQLFAVFFYILLFFLALQLVAGFVASLIFGSIIYIALSAFGILTVAFLVFRKKLYSLLMLIFFSLPFFTFFMVYPLVQSFVPSGNTLMYFLIPLNALIIGLLASFMFGRVVDTFKKFLNTAIIFSSMLAVIFSLNVLINLLFAALNEKLKILTGGVGGVEMMVAPGILSMFGTAQVNPYIGFALAFIFLNIPYFFFYFKIQDKKLYLLLLYLIPIILFVVLSYSMSFVFEFLMSFLDKLLTSQLPIVMT
ncbi:MAG: hypothetical protein KJ583_02205 [Nanoarchaeota archaeon]|nr:hypothetical protein [Nanoarchaeota archaeon]MBU1604107.1 hypothetical protein [Nanoarchaeota archaeon]MBU2443327.1 hypothetical protein [Nanoarchaeota archaeon]